MAQSYYDYDSMIAEAASLLVRLEGRRLLSFFTHVVEPEFNAAYLVLDDGVFSMYGRVGGEVLRIVQVDQAQLNNLEGDAAVKPFDPFSIFLNRRIVQARSIGSAWNGHGFELSFEGLPDRTMIVQSIYAGEKPADFDDCLRFGVGHYFFDASSQQSPGR